MKNSNRPPQQGLCENCGAICTLAFALGAIGLACYAIRMANDQGVTSMYRIIKYPDLIQTGSGRPADEKTYRTVRDAQRALMAQYPGKSLSEIMRSAKKRVEKVAAVKS